MYYDGEEARGHQRVIAMLSSKRIQARKPIHLNSLPVILVEDVHSHDGLVEIGVGRLDDFIVRVFLKKGYE